MRITATILLAATAALGLSAVASAQQRLPRECRQEIRQLCGSDRSQIRECLREKASELSETCRSELRERMGSRRGDRRAPAQSSAIAPDTAIMFGAHSRQQIDFYSANGEAADNGEAPVILFVHGGGWAVGDRAQAVHAKPAHFTTNGIAFASTGYRLVPEVTVEEQAADIASALAALRGQAETLGIDPDRVILMGHSAGAHLAALVATDPQYAGADMAAVKGVVLLDGAGYDVVNRMEDAADRSALLYSNAFGDDPARQAALSPITHTDAPNAPAWQILFVGNRAESRAQSEALALALREAGAEAEAVPIADSDHRKLNVELGKPGDPATALVDAFLESLSG
ncbi:alpha/beta hydrolase [Altererythrobacter lutimaris]|uniref:Alpha/beta hydrolase n=1 Tax=Altererythrobacter lutimaris TaxID=2743979 RepID=A0A850HAB5_9SPHN|nr:alpha/beta hydrolase [Altererythrobacter lutimaris]NVE94659.1 alpha/beta hydrolase [Altererythrobacter lutimaris]